MEPSQNLTSNFMSYIIKNFMHLMCWEIYRTMQQYCLIWKRVNIWNKPTATLRWGFGASYLFLLEGSTLVYPLQNVCLHRWDHVALFPAALASLSLTRWIFCASYTPKHSATNLPQMNWDVVYAVFQMVAIFTQDLCIFLRKFHFLAAECVSVACC